MKAMEHLLIQELTKIHALESKLYSSFNALSDASNDQVENFVNGLTDLERRTSRIERLLETLGAPETLAA